MIGPHTQRDNPLSRIMCTPIVPHSCGVKLWKFDYFFVFLESFVQSPRKFVQKWVRVMKKRIRERVSKSVHGQCVGEISTCVKSAVIWTSVKYLSRPRETSRNTSLMQWRTNDGLKTIILNSSSGGVVFLTPRTTRGSLSLICQVQNTWSGNLTSSGTKIT